MAVAQALRYLLYRGDTYAWAACAAATVTASMLVARCRRPWAAMTDAVMSCAWLASVAFWGACVYADNISMNLSDPASPALGLGFGISAMRLAKGRVEKALAWIALLLNCLVVIALAWLLIQEL